MHTDLLLNNAINRVHTCYEIAERYLNRGFNRPDVNLNQRGKIAGSAHLQSNQIRLNRRLYADNQQAFLEQVIPHEICHLLAFNLYGKVRPHGHQWQALMREVYGLTPHIHHQFDVSQVAGRSFEYACGCGQVRLSLRRHNKVIRNQQQYCCRACNQILTPVAKTSV